MTLPWFKKFGVWYYPLSWQGWLITLAALTFCVHTTFAVNQHVNSVSDLLYGIFPFVVPTILAWERIAAKTTQE